MQPGLLSFDLIKTVSDLAPITTTSGPVAAQAFHKILSLATKDLVRVLEQDEPYGEVSDYCFALFTW